MRKYKNVSNKRLYLDCMNYTIYMESNDIKVLPICRDVRYYTKRGDLFPMRDRRIEVKNIDNVLPVLKPKKQWKSNKNSNKPDSNLNLEKMETE